MTGAIESKWEMLGPGESLELQGLPSEAWVLRPADGSFGVAVRHSGEPVEEEFASVALRTLDLKFTGYRGSQCLMLSSPEPGANFATVCADLLSARAAEGSGWDPAAWWESWKTLLGNRSVDLRVYDVLGELLTMLYLSEAGRRPIWTGPEGSTHDIECPDDLFEVKSTLSRNSTTVQMHGLFQAQPDEARPKTLVLCRFEPSTEGWSINSAVKRLSKHVLESDLNERLCRLGYPVGKSARNRCFALLEMLGYPMDDAFPKITTGSFVGGVKPQGVESINYTVTLSGLTALKMATPTL